MTPAQRQSFRRRVWRAALLGWCCLICSIGLAPIGPQGEVIRENAQHMRERGFLLVDGKWVEPQMTLQWSELIRYEREGGDVRLVPALSDKLLERLKNNRQVLAVVGPDEMPFQVNARMQWLNGRQEEGVWLQLRAVEQTPPGTEAADWRVIVVNLTPRQFTVVARREVEGGFQQHSIAARPDGRFTVMTNEHANPPHGNRALGQVILEGSDSDITVLLAAPDEALAWRSWDVFELLTDGGPHPLRPLAGDMVEPSDEEPLLESVRALLPRMIDRSGTVRASASADLSAMETAALPAVLWLLEEPLLPEQRARLESFVAEHALYRDDPISPDRLREMHRRSR